MYTEFYGFSMKPFQLTPDPEFLYLSSAHKKALAYLTYGIEDRSGFVAITGEIGAGKTTLIRVLMQGLGSDTIVARISNTMITNQQFLEMVLGDFELSYEGKTKTQLLDTLNNFLIEQYARKKQVVLIIDEAQNLSVPLLEEVRMLSNLETDKSKLLQIIFVGQPKLREKLGLPELEQLRQRITVSYHLTPLNREEVEGYVLHRIEVVAPPGAVTFTAEALDEVYASSRGIPRLVNVICDGALLAGYASEQRTITAEMVKETVIDLGYDQLPAHSPARTAQTGHKGAGQISELKDRIEELAARLEGLDKKGLESAGVARQAGPQEVPVPPQQEQPRLPETLDAERAELKELRRQVDEKEHRLSVVEQRQKEQAQALKEREVMVEQERLRILALVDDLTKREELLADRIEGLEASSPAAIMRLMPPMNLEVFLLEGDEKLRGATLGGMAARNIETRSFADRDALLSELRRARGAGVYPVVVIDAMEQGVDAVQAGGFRETVRLLGSEFPSVRKLLTTACPYYSLRREAMMSGVDYVLAKPDHREMDTRLFDLVMQQYLEELSCCVRRVFEQSTAFAGDMLEAEAVRQHD